MFSRKAGPAPSVAGRNAAAFACVLCAVLTLTGGTGALAQTPDRYRCIPSDGSPPYTTPYESCRGDVIRREPLSQEEIAEAWDVQTRGRPFTRCTAADGRYSQFVPDDQACPSPTDKRTVEYAKKSIERQKHEAEIVARAAASVRTTAVAPEPKSAPDAEAALSPPPLLPPQAAPAPINPAAAAAPSAVTPAPAPAAVMPPPRTSTESPPSRSKTIFLWLAVALVAIWTARKWHARGQTLAEPDQPETKPAQAAQRAPKPAKPENEHAQKPAQPDPAASNTDMARLAQTLLGVLEKPDAAATLPGGMAFLTALKQAKLDHTLKSVERVDQLLTQIKTKMAPQRSQWDKQPGTENFRLLLAFYLGAVISRLSGEPIRWYSREQAATMMPPDMQLPDESWSRLVGVLAASPCVPLGVIENSLFGSDAPAMTCKAYVERFVGKLRQALTPGMDENKRCAIMLETFMAEKPMFGGLAFEAQLRRAGLDHSLESLQRLDKLLRSLRPAIKPPYTAFINQSDSQNFMRFAAFYIGMTVARLGSMPVKWLDFEQAKKNLPELEFEFATSSVCLLGGRVFFPLGLVAEILLHPHAQRNIPDWARQALGTAPPPMPSILRSSLQSTAVDAAGIDDVLKTAIGRAGFMAAWAMFMVEGGANGAPTVFVPTASEGGMFRDFSFYDDGESAFQAAYRLMKDNPDGAPFQVMSYDGYANLHTGRTDALTIELSVYAPKPSSGQTRFKLTVVCPYRNAGDPKGFAIYSPKVTECSGSDGMQAAIHKLFYQGVASYKSNSFDWFGHLDESI